MLDIFKPLIESNVLSEKTHQELQEAWESKILEVRDEVTSELREEFAQRYEHDKKQLVQALDTMVTESLKKELTEFSEDQRALAKERVQVRRQVAEHAKKLNRFVAEALAKEIKEFNNDRLAQSAAMGKLEKFVTKSLSEEIAEFSEDKQDLIETKVKLVSEAKGELAALKKQFIKRSAKLVEDTVTDTIKTELTQLQEDIKVARENNFGRQIFEAFAAEWMTSYLNENTEVSKLSKEIAVFEDKLQKMQEKMNEKDTLIEAAKSKLRAMDDRVKRSKVMESLLAPLGKDKRAVMMDLLESVRTSDLERSFNKYLPAVLDGSKPVAKRRPLTESANVRREATGNKKTKKTVDETAEDNNIFDIQKLAGLKK